MDGRPGYFKLVDLPDLFPVLPASAATLLRDVTVEEAVSLFHKFVGKNLTEDLVVRILEAYVPMKIQIRQEEVWASQFQRNKACIGTQRMHRLDAGHLDYKFMCKACGTGWPEAANQCWVTYNLLIVEGKPTWIQQRDGGSLGAAGPGGTRAQADRNLVDGTILGRAPPKTDTAEEITMADVVPLNRRVDIRQEKALRKHREPTPEESSARQRHKELVTDEMLDNEMAILAPLQEGMQALPAEEVANEGAQPLRKVNVEQFKAKLGDQYLEGKGVDASQALADAMGSIQEAQKANKRTQPTRRGCLTTPSSPWHGQMISGRLWRQRGGHQGEVRPLHPEAQRGAEPVEPGRRRCWRRCPIWRRRPPPRVSRAPGGTSRRTWTRRRVSCPCSSGR